jgi:hypothetical protein
MLIKNTLRYYRMSIEQQANELKDRAALIRMSARMADRQQDSEAEFELARRLDEQANNLLNQPENEMAEEKVKKPRKPRVTKKDKLSKPSHMKGLIDALKFISLAQKKAGTDDARFCLIKDQWAIAANGELIIGTPIEEDLDAAPLTFKFLDALNACKEELQVTQLSKFELSIKSGLFQASVECIEPESFDLSIIDPPVGTIDDKIKIAFQDVEKLVSENATNILFGVVLLQANSVVATDGCAIVEHWHGINLPPNLLIPKAAVTAVIKSGKELCSFGFTEDTFTFHFIDGSFIRTNLVKEPYLNYHPVLNVACNPIPLPKSFMEGVSTIADFAVDNIVSFDHNGLFVSKGTYFKIEGLPEHIAFSSKYLKLLEPLMKTVDFDVAKQQALFFGDNVRGILKACE